MLLRKIKLENFKKFKALEREFGPGINVVKGILNEMGKSTLLDAIVTALFENPKSARKELEEYTTWGSDRKYNTVIEFDVQGGKFILEKDFDKKGIRLALVDNSKEWETPTEVRGKLRELIGTDSPDLFISTSCIRQNDVRDIESGSKEIGESLESIVTGGTEQTAASQIIDKLAKQINNFTKGLERLTNSPGPLADLNQQISKLQNDLLQVKGEVSAVESQKLILVKTSNDLTKVEKELNEAAALFEKNKRRQEIEKTVNDLEKKYEKIDRLIQDLVSLKKQIDKADSELQAISGFDNFEKVQHVKNHLPEFEINRRKISKDLLDGKEKLEANEEYLRRNKLRVILTSKTALMAGIVLSAIGFIGILLNTASLAIGIIGLLFLIGAMWIRNTLTECRTQICDWKNRIGQMENALIEIEKEEGSILSQVNCSSIEEFTQKEKGFAGLVKQRTSFQNQLVGKLGTQSIEQIERERLDVVKSLAVEQEKITDDLKNTRLSPDKYIDLESRVKQFGIEKRQLEMSKLKSEVSINNARFNTEDQAKIEERLASLTSDLKRKQRRLQIYQLAKDFLSRAKNETLVVTEDILQTQIQRNFEIFTNGKYKKVKVDKGSMDFHIYSEEKGDWTRPEELSSGVIDEFYLACRLALVRLIYGEAKPPLIFDDPFTNFDKPRLTHTLEFLKHMSNEYQIILFTLSDAYDNIADRIIELT